MPSSYTLSLDSMDELEDIPSVTTSTESSENFLSLNVVPGLPPRRLWDYTVLAYGCQDSVVLNDTELSELLCVCEHNMI